MNLSGFASFLNNRFSPLLLIAVVSFLSYSNTFQVPFQFDDPGNINGKAYVRDIGAFFDSKKIEPDTSFIMRKVTYFTFAMNYLIHGNNVLGYHIVNLLIHTINSFLVYFLVLFTFRTPYFSSHHSAIISQPSSSASTLNPQPSTRFIALLAALIFVSHPIQTQAVTYIVQRLASLATMFFLLSLVLYIKWRLLSNEFNPATPPHRKSTWLTHRSIIWYLLAFISASLAMKSKEIAFTLPILMVFYELMFFDGILQKRLLYLLPFTFTMLIIPLGLLSIGEPTGEIIGDISETTRVGTALPRSDYLFTQFRVIITYIRLLFLPAKQNLDYDYPLYHTFFDPNVFLSFLLLLFIFGLGVYLFNRSRATHQDSPPSGSRITHYASRLIAFGIFWFFITLSVESSIIPIADVIYEHRVYLPSVGFFIAVTAGGFIVWDRINGKMPAKAVLAFCILIVLVLSGATYARNNVWKSEVRLWEDVAEKSPMKARSYNGLGLAYQNEGLIDKAVENFRRSVAIDPEYGAAHNSLGAAYFRKNLLEHALKEFDTAISLEPENAIFRNNRGLTYAALGEIETAKADYAEAIRLEPSFDDAFHNLGFAFHRDGLFNRAVQEYTRAIAIRPDEAVYYNNRGLSYSALGEFDRALADYSKAVSLNPDFADAFIGRGVVLGELGRLSESIADFSMAVSLDPSSASAYFNRAVAYDRVQDVGRALSDFQKSCEMGDTRGCDGVEYLQKKLVRPDK